MKNNEYNFTFIYLFTFICAAITQKKKQDSIIMNSYEAQMGIQSYIWL